LARRGDEGGGYYLIICRPLGIARNEDEEVWKIGTEFRRLDLSPLFGVTFALRLMVFRMMALVGACRCRWRTAAPAPGVAVCHGSAEGFLVHRYRLVYNGLRVMAQLSIYFKR